MSSQHLPIPMISSHLLQLLTKLSCKTCSIHWPRFCISHSTNFPFLYPRLTAIRIDCERPHVHRRGSAWGLAGLVKGMGIGSLKNFGILERIKEATEDQVCPQPCGRPLLPLHSVPLSLLFFVLAHPSQSTTYLF